VGVSLGEVGVGVGKGREADLRFLLNPRLHACWLCIV
jgi:hypothetical protein